MDAYRAGMMAFAKRAKENGWTEDEVRWVVEQCNAELRRHIRDGRFNQTETLKYFAKQVMIKRKLAGGLKMTDEEIKQKALEAYPVKHMEAQGWTCVDENEVKRAAYAEGLKAATETSMKDMMRAARDRCEAVITKAVRQYNEETGLNVRGLEAVIAENGEIVRVAVEVDLHLIG